MNRCWLVHEIYSLYYVKGCIIFFDINVEIRQLLCKHKFIKLEHITRVSDLDCYHLPRLFLFLCFLVSLKKMKINHFFMLHHILSICQLQKPPLLLFRGTKEKKSQWIRTNYNTGIAMSSIE